jgi:hypothetical protein
MERQKEAWLRKRDFRTGAIQNILVGLKDWNQWKRWQRETGDARIVGNEKMH